ncbi:YraN family protein [Devosia sp.]|uniref:YraN family protein n=1 Tax=Devosia sp. TaxID=1871048 RepID=UPI003A920CF4
MPRSPSKPHPSRLAAELFGRRGERLAAWYLRAKFYTIVAERVRTPVGEIDLVARRGGVTVFVEVKARRSTHAYADALAAVNRRRISRAAGYYLSRHPALAATTLRFDVIFLAPFRWPRHLKHAFDASQDVT